VSPFVWTSALGASTSTSENGASAPNGSRRRTTLSADAIGKPLNARKLDQLDPKRPGVFCGDEAFATQPLSRQDAKANGSVNRMPAESNVLRSGAWREPRACRAGKWFVHLQVSKSSMIARACAPLSETHGLAFVISV
jgi:hypothetical protein